MATLDTAQAGHHPHHAPGEIGAIEVLEEVRRPKARPSSKAPKGRRPKETTAADRLTLVGSAFSAAWVTWLVFGRLTDGTGWFGFLVIAYLVFLGIYTVVTYDQHGWLVAKDRIARVLVKTCGVIVLVPMLWLIGYIVVRGLSALRPGFFVHDQAGITPIMPADAGGGGHAVLGTLEIVALALVISLPLALLCAVFLNESRSRWRAPVRVFVDAMSGLPSVIAGLFIFAVFILPFATSNNSLLSYNGLMGALALSVTMLPTICRTVEVVLRLVPDGLREASLALGASRARTTWSVVFPTARTGMATAVVLGIARAVGETAPLLMTAFGYDLLNANPFSGAQENLPLFIYRNIRKPDLAAVDRGFAGALVLMLVVLFLFIVTRVVGRDRSKTNARRAARRRSRVTPTKETIA